MNYAKDLLKIAVYVKFLHIPSQAYTGICTVKCTGMCTGKWPGNTHRDIFSES